jgi:hypothetical protein
MPDNDSASPVRPAPYGAGAAGKFIGQGCIDITKLILLFR